MSQKFASFGFLGLLALISLWFVVDAGRALYRYERFKIPLQANVSSWGIVEKKAGLYQITVDMEYVYLEKAYFARDAFARTYPNRWAAEKALAKESENHYLNIWIHSKRPDMCTLEKKIPVKKIFSSVITLLLLGYFCCLILYVGKKQDQSYGTRAARNSDFEE